MMSSKIRFRTLGATQKFQFLSNRVFILTERRNLFVVTFSIFFLETINQLETWCSVFKWRQINQENVSYNIIATLLLFFITLTNK